MLKALMDKGCTLIDYERIVDDMNRRIIFFGRFAGLAGMINTLWAIGLRLKEYNIETPFLKIRQAYTYSSLEEARTAVADVGLEIAEGGLPSELQPFVVGITGYGNVSQGVQEILGLLPVKEIMVNKLTELSSRKSAPTTQWAGWCPARRSKIPRGFSAFRPAHPQPRGSPGRAAGS